nr:isoprenylcysteine carboxylmethyltransferase family protein [Jannaschia sp. Os4]
MSALLARLLPAADLGAAGRVLGALEVAFALGLIAWAALPFLRLRTPIEPHHRPTALITGGPYAFTRNPIYLGLMGLALGYALWLGPLAATLPVAALAYVLDRRFAAPEEALLIDAFGAEGRAYVDRVGRWA